MVTGKPKPFTMSAYNERLKVESSPQGDEPLVCRTLFFGTCTCFELPFHRKSLFVNMKALGILKVQAEKSQRLKHQKKKL